MSKYVSGCTPFSVSQNFLTSSATIRCLIRLTNIGSCDHVIEIGAGKGHITRQLLAVAGKVTAYEIDPTLCRVLTRALGDADGLAICSGDFLNAALPAKSPYKVFSNIPFSITTPIVRKLMGASNPPKDAWLVMELGAAKRLLGLGRESAMSLSIKPNFDTRIVHRFARSDFHPIPAVDAVLVHFSRKDVPDLNPSERGAFSAFVQGCLAHGVGRYLTKKQVSTALRVAGLPEIGPSGEMRYVQWLCLFRCSRRFGGNQR